MSGKGRAKKSTKKSSKKKSAIKLGGEVADYQNCRMEEYCMFFESCRLMTFSDWPFDEDNSCNPRALAAAGFCHIPTNGEPDGTRCFCCFKELDGWEPDDNPWDEHKKHSPQCAFLSLNKPIEDLTTAEFFKLDCERQKNKWRKFNHMKLQEVESQAEHICKEMAKIIK